MEKPTFRNSLPLLIFFISFAAFAIATGYSLDLIPEKSSNPQKGGPITIGSAFPEVVPGEVVLKLKKEVPPSPLPEFLLRINKTYNILSFEKIFADETEPPFSRFYITRFPPETDTKKVIDDLKTAEEFLEYSEPNYIYKALKTPNDPQFPKLWGLKKIEAEGAWEISTGGSSVIVAIIDTGVDYKHEDLSLNITPGWDYADDDNDPTDQNGHGTHVAGIIGAVGNNALGVAGVNWKVKIMPVRVLDRDGLGSGTDILQGIKYAADHGAKIINMSLGAPYLDYSLKEVIDYAYKKGISIVAAAGNCDYGCPVKNYPAAFESVIAVANTTSTDQRNRSSSYYDEVELSAPGTDILSTIPANRYQSFSGTSMAAPHVAGVAALVFSLHPEMSAPSLRAKLQQAVEDLGSPGRDPYFGYGRINARKALEGTAPPPGDAEPPTISITTPTSTSTLSGQVTIGIEAEDNVGVTKIAAYTNGTLIGETSGNFQAQVYNGPIGAIAEGETQLNFMNKRFRSDDIINVKTEGMTAGYLEGGFFVFYGGNRWQAAQQVLEHFRPTDNPPPSATYQIPWDTTQFANGQYSLKAKAWDAAGNEGESVPIQVTVSNQPPLDTQPPNVSITSPQNGEAVRGTVAIQATASDNVGVKRVDFYVDGQKTSGDSFSPYTADWNTVSLPNDSSHQLQAKAYDDADNEGVSNIVTVAIDNLVPPSPPAQLNFKVSNWSNFPDNISVTLTAIEEEGNFIPGFSVQTTTNTSGDGRVSLAALTIGEKYYFYIKGEKHLRKRSSLPTTVQEGANPPSESLDFGVLTVGDVNNDNQITLDDLKIIANNFYKKVPPGDPRADLNEDGVINLFDLVAAGANFGAKGD